jgi:alpha-glucosidase
MHWTKGIASHAAVLLFGMAALITSAQHIAAQSTAAEGENWWKNAVVYEIYPRSFQDSNGDGIGDLKGITSRLDYLEQLGVDAIWLTPIYPSPQVDFGYDISDYESIDPQYGTLDDFDRLIAEANKLHIRVIMDMVMNHTSDQHKWFLESRSSRTNPYRDWYMWHDGKGETATSPGEPPNNWESDFGGSAWQWDGKTRQYYYHKFYAQQPDLNWHNPQVHQAFENIMRFWLKRGVAGFRFDAITTLFEDPQMRDEDVLKDKNGNPMLRNGKPVLNDTRTNNLPEVHPVMQEMRRVADEFDSKQFPGKRVLIGETYLPNIADLEKEYGPPGKPEFELPMDTQVGFINKLDVTTFRTRIDEAEHQLGGHIPLFVFDNHDNPRLDVRYGDDLHNIDIYRVISTLLFASRGASLFYYGDAIGMKTTPPASKEDVKDPVGLRDWPEFKGRDGERTPMQWDDSPNAGFTAAGVSPWLPVPPQYHEINVKAEEPNPDSLLTWYKSIIHLKQTNLALAEGEETMLDIANDKVLSWMREAPGHPTVVVSVNFTAEPQSVSLSVPSPRTSLKTLLKTPGEVDPVSLREIQLAPYGVYIGEVRR